MVLKDLTDVILVIITGVGFLISFVNVNCKAVAMLRLARSGLIVGKVTLLPSSFKLLSPGC